MERFTGLLEQAKRWEELVAELAEKQAALQNILALLARAGEIESNFQEWQGLQQVLPTLKQVVEQQQHIANSQQRTRALQNTLDPLSALVLRAQSEQNAVAEQVCQLDQAIEHVQQEKAQRQHRLTELAPIVAKLNQVKSLRAQVASLQAQLSAFSPDIEKCLHEIEDSMFALLKGVAGKDTMWYQRGEQKTLRPQRSPMPQPIMVY